MPSLAPLLNLLRQFFPPDLSLHYLRAALMPLGQTLAMAAGGIFIAIIAGLFAGVWAGVGLPGQRAVYAALASIRSIPDLTLAILCVVLVGIGPAAGMMALAIFYGAAIGKIFADLFHSADRNTVDALRATGATRLSVAWFGQLPLRAKDILSYGTYEFESAIRASVIVGAVGGGGIGTELVGSINALDFHRATTLILMLIALIAVIDRLARVVKQRPASLLLVFPLTAVAAWHGRPEMVAFSHSITAFSKMVPPDLPGDAIRQLPKLLLETFEIAIGGTFFAILGALPLGLAAARYFTPVWISTPVRRILEGFRAVPEIVWGLLLVSVIGTGPEAGVVALALHGTGSLGRLYAESFENIRTEPVHAIAATGARPLAIAGFAYIPLALAPLVVHTLFRLEWNVRAATIVGVIGAGGIGQALFNAQQLFFYRQMTAYILITWLIVAAVDYASGRFRTDLGLMERYA
ncbi:MAG TPA: ABC transporter permease subunit [Bryobacteraceae bacterium]|nr:ABC transporter permease subunit [Bryobacteraceae bacterium]